MSFSFGNTLCEFERLEMPKIKIDTKKSATRLDYYPHQL